MNIVDTNNWTIMTRANSSRNCRLVSGVGSDSSSSRVGSSGSGSGRSSGVGSGGGSGGGSGDGSGNGRGGGSGTSSRGESTDYGCHLVVIVRDLDYRKTIKR